MIEPFGDRLLVEPISAEEKVGSVYLPDQAREDQKLGTVRATGRGILTESGTVVPPEAAVGDVVFYSPYGGIKVKEGLTEYLLLTSSDILGRKT